MAAVVVNSLSDVTVDGVAAGAVTDVLTNFKAVAGIRGEVLRAMKAWAAARDAAHAEALADRDDRIAKLQAQVDALGGTDAALALARAKRRADAESARAAAEKELAAIDVEATAKA